MRGERWREQRQWVIHEWSHVLNFLKELGESRGEEGCSRWVDLSFPLNTSHWFTRETKTICTSQIHHNSLFLCRKWQMKHSWLLYGGANGFCFVGRWRRNWRGRTGWAVMRKWQNDLKSTDGKEGRRTSARGVGDRRSPAITKSRRRQRMIRSASPGSSNPQHTHEPRYSCPKTTGGGRCVWLFCVCVMSNLVTRLVSIPIVPWDCCSSEKKEEEEVKRNYFLLLRVILPYSKAGHSVHSTGCESISSMGHLCAKPPKSTGWSEVYFPSIHLTSLWLSTVTLHWNQWILKAGCSDRKIIIS